jgi:pimeloyl-ACP methyl ester carboxylesterase
MSAPNAPPSAPPRRFEWRLDVSEAVPLDGRFELAATLIAPAASDDAPPVDTLLFCLPGGFLSRRYFDLAAPDEMDESGGAGDASGRRYSFAEAMARRGLAVLAVDPLGVGDSTRPDPPELGFGIGVDEVVRANQAALVRALERLAAGSVPGLEIRRSLGVGHSMGSLLTVEQQALARAHDALVLFSFTTRGTPAFLDDTMRRYAGEPGRLRAEMPDLVRRTMGTPYPERAEGPESDRRAAFGVGTAPGDAEEALHAASTRLFAAGGLTAMIPAGAAPAAARVDVPVLMVFADHDLHDDRSTRQELPNVPSLTTFELSDAWHCHFVANTRETLWHVVADWIAQRA